MTFPGKLEYEGIFFWTRKTSSSSSQERMASANIRLHEILAPLEIMRRGVRRYMELIYNSKNKVLP
jgi:hypothetical protein